MEHSTGQKQLEELLEKLHHGEADAAEAVFRTYEPFLRMVVRRQLTTALRSKFDSIDIVQSVWVDLIQGFRDAGWRFTEAAQLKRFLVRATRNRFIDRIRQHRRTLDKEKQFPAAPEDSELEEAVLDSADGPTALARANDLWRRLLATCPAAHRPILELKRQGYAASEIAKRTGLHPGTVRRILYNVARKMAREE